MYSRMAQLVIIRSQIIRRLFCVATMRKSGSVRDNILSHEVEMNQWLE